MTLDSKIRIEPTSTGFRKTVLSRARKFGVWVSNVLIAVWNERHRGLTDLQTLHVLAHASSKASRIKKPPKIWDACHERIQEKKNALRTLL